MTEKLTRWSREKSIKKILPDKYKVLDTYESLKKQIEENMDRFSEEEIEWLYGAFSYERKKNKKTETIRVNHIEALPEIIKRPIYANIMFCLLKNPGIAISDISEKLGKYTKSIQIARKRLENLNLIYVYQNPITRKTKCYLNDGNISNNGAPVLPTITKIVLKLMEEEHGKSNIKKRISVNRNVQKKAEKKYRKRTTS